MVAGGRKVRPNFVGHKAEAVGAVGIDVAITALAVFTIVLRSVGVYESLLLLLLARPMWDFVRVLRDTTGPDVPSATNDRK